MSFYAIDCTGTDNLTPNIREQNAQTTNSGFLLLCRIHFPWLFQTKK